MKNDVWKPVVGYESLYHVSNLERLKSIPRLVKIRGGKFRLTPEKILSDGIRKDGYRSVILCSESGQKRFVTHRLIAIAFIPNPLNLPDVNHKDGNKINNRVDNLEWIDKKGNMQHAYKTHLINHDFLKKSGLKASIVRERKVNQYSLEGILIATHTSLKIAGDTTNTISSNICSCCSGRYKSAGGYIWKYV